MHGFLTAFFASRLALSGAVIYAAIFLSFYPPMYSTLDEDNYLTMSYVLKAGTIYYDQAGYAPTFTTTTANGHVVSKHPPGNSLLLIPFILFGVKSAFLSGLAFHVLGYFLFTRVLVRARNCRPGQAAVFGVLYLCFPVFLIQSRTLLSDLPSEVLVLAGFYAYLSQRLTGAGALWGLATLVRSTNALIPAVFALGWLMTLPDRRSKSAGLLRLSLGLLPFGLGILLNNYYAFGGIFTVPDNLLAASSFSLSFVPQNLRFFVVSLLVVYPFMLVGPLLYRGPARLEILLAIAAFLAFHSLYYYLQTWDRPLEWLVLASRHLMPVMPFFLLCYADVWNTARKMAPKWLPDRMGPIVAATSVAVALLTSAAVQARHHEFQTQLADYRDRMYRHTPENAVVFGTIDAVKLLNPGWGVRDRRLLMHFDECLPIDEFIDDAFTEARPVYVIGLRRDFKDPTNAVERCVESVVKRYRSDLVYEEEMPWRFSIYRLVRSDKPVWNVSKQ